MTADSFTKGVEVIARAFDEMVAGGLQRNLPLYQREALMEELKFKVIAHNSSEYAAEVALRHSILRQPLGLAFSADQLLAEADSYHIGCYMDEALVGCLVLKPVDVGNVQMRQVAVAESMQGKGVGRMMVKHSEAFAKRQGFQRMVLHARETAVPFYESLGYARVGNRFVEIALPHWEMAKVL